MSMPDLGTVVDVITGHGLERASGSGSLGDTLCCLCASIRVVLPRQGETWTFREGSAVDAVRNGRSGCRLCQLLTRACRLKLDASAAATTLRLQLSYVNGSHDLAILYGRTTGKEFRPQPLMISRLHPSDGSGTEKATSEADLTGASLDLVRSWVAQCNEKHSCRGIGDTTLPTRVLDLSGSDKDHVRLKLSAEGEQGRYAALSYCWGWTDITNKTTPENLDQQMTGIRVTDLPKTLRDAVTVTRALYIPYLWNDALCILQGDSSQAKEDWVRESSRMSEVYGHAYLTLCAAGASSCDGGMIADTSCSVPFVDLQALPDASSAQPTISYGQMRVCLPAARADFKDEPIMSRAWTLQENLLSHRVLIYTSTDIWWQCDASMMSKNYPGGPSSLPRLGVGLSPMNRTYKMRLFRPGEPGWLPSWEFILQAYCGRNLSRASDKLPALAGIAKHFAMRTGDTYLAGLWKSKLLYHLLWARDSHFGSWVYTAADVARPRDPIRAPSWSWASVDGNVRIPYSRASSGHTVRFDAEVVDCTVELLHPDYPFGEIKGGILTLKARLKKISRIAMVQSTPAIYAFQTDQVETDDFELGRAWTDDEEANAVAQAEAADAVYALLLNWDEELWFLVVVPVESKSDHFERIAIACTGSGRECNTWWVDAPRQTVTII